MHSPAIQAGSDQHFTLEREEEIIVRIPMFPSKENEAWTAAGYEITEDLQKAAHSAKLSGLPSARNSEGMRNMHQILNLLIEISNNMYRSSKQQDLVFRQQEKASKGSHPDVNLAEQTVYHA
jgi:hypothetical protein